MPALPDDKDDSILLFLRELSAQSVDWQLKDHWQGDRNAIGLTSASLPERLAYVSTWQESPGEYYVELELLALGATIETTISDPYPLAEALTYVRNHLDSTHDPRWPGRRPFWDVETAAEITVIRRVLQRRFPDLYQRLTTALEQADPYDVVDPDNPHEYDDVIREFLVMADPVDGDLTHLSEDQTTDLLKAALARCFGERLDESKLHHAVALLRSTAQTDQTAR
jgi:hypothetical protein